jgi:hypothetical protein
MTTKMQRDELTDERVEALLQEAASAGDDDTVRDCRTLLAGRSAGYAEYVAATARICRVLDDAAAQREDS